MTKMKAVQETVKFLIATACWVCFGLLFAQASTPPKVVFIGDQITYNWTSAFAANPNWVNKGSSGLFSGGLVPGTEASDLMVARFQSDVVNQHPAIVHIMAGLGDANHIDDGTYRIVIPLLLTNIRTMVQEAQAANIKVVLGIEPTIMNYDSATFQRMNAVVADYGAMNGIPVINYGNLLCSCANSAAGVGSDSMGNPYLGVPPGLPQPFSQFEYLPTTAGYAAMTQMAEDVIAAQYLTLRGGWLQDTQQFNDNEQCQPGLTGRLWSNVNSVCSDAILQFTPVGFYSDGSTHLFMNTNFQGSNGTWTSSNPTVMRVDQDGVAWALYPGTARISYVSPSGVHFSPWDMTVYGSGIPGLPF